VTAVAATSPAAVQLDSRRTCRRPRCRARARWLPACSSGTASPGRG